MKKLAMIFAVLALMAGTSAFANTGDKVTKAVKVEFQKNFPVAENVTWEIAEDFYFASFDLNGRTVNAAYNENGELVGVSRKLQLSEIPLGILQSLQSGYAGYVIGNKVTEVVYEGKTFYYATAEGATRILKLKCFTDGEIYVEKKIKK
ncbi:MAG: hypothetical protein ABI741_11130 [Ferruginibacter sp.]